VDKGSRLRVILAQIGKPLAKLSQTLAILFKILSMGAYLLSIRLESALDFACIRVVFAGTRPWPFAVGESFPEKPMTDDRRKHVTPRALPTRCN